MSRDLRMEQAGAIWTERYDSLQDLRERGTVTGAPTIVAGPGARALRMVTNGANFQAANQPHASIGLGSMTAFTRFRTDGRGGYPMLTDGATGAPYALYPTIVAPGRAMAMVQDTAALQVTVTGTTTVTDGAWHSTALVLDRVANLLHLYVDGVEEGTAPSTAALVALIDATAVGTWHITAIDATYLEASEQSVFNRALSASEVLSLHNRSVWDYDRYLVSRWDMSEINPQDVGWPGNGNNGTGTNIAASDIVDGPFGGKALDLDGATEYVTCGYRATLNFTSEDFSLACLVKPADLGTAGHDIMLGNALAGAGYLFYLRDGLLKFETRQAAASQITATGATPVVGMWQLFGAARSGSTAKVYINGVDMTVTSGTHVNPVSSAAAFDIGASIGAAFTNGLLGGAMVWNACLNAIQFRDFYERLRRGRA